VEKFLACGDLECGFARVRCDACRAEFLVAFSCKARYLCPSCHAKWLVIWSEWLDFLRTTMREPLGVPGVVASVQTFGTLVNFHPHLHLLVTDGVFRPDGTFIHLGFHQIDWPHSAVFVTMVPTRFGAGTNGARKACCATCNCPAIPARPRRATRPSRPGPRSARAGDVGPNTDDSAVSRPAMPRQFPAGKPPAIAGSRDAGRPKGRFPLPNPPARSTSSPMPSENCPSAPGREATYYPSGLPVCRCPVPLAIVTPGAVRAVGGIHPSEYR